MKSIIRALVLCATTALAAGPSWRGRFNMRLPKPESHNPAHITEGSFKQLIDHSNASLGTFDQRYWYSSEFWKGPGSPIVFFTPGEENAIDYIGYCTNETLNGAVAQEIGGAAIVMEHRYWGTSSPYKKLTTANMQYLTLENNIADTVYFAQNVKLPFTKGAASNAKDVPWVFIGGSYSGALSAYTASVAPGTFWAYLATSAPVQTISNFWQYFEPVQQGMAKNCSADVTRVINYMDGVLENGTAEEITALKTKFGLESVKHNDDFMSALQNGPWQWQENAFYYESGFFEWCDYIENAVNVTDPSKLPGPNGVGLTKALEGYATWMKTVELPGFCEGYGFSGTYNTECLDTYNADNPMFTNVSLSNSYNRQWDWILCNQPFGFWQDGAPANKPSIVSRLVDAKYWTRQCALLFPTGPQGQTYGIAKGATEAEVNAYTGGWEFTNTTRLIYTNGEFDPWRSASVSSTFRPGGPLQSSPGRPVNLVPDGVHCYDLIMAGGDANAKLKAIQNSEIKQLAAWVAEFKAPGPYGNGN